MQLIRRLPKIPGSVDFFPGSFKKIPGSSCHGNWLTSQGFSSLFRAPTGPARPELIIFPVIFPLNGNFAARQPFADAAALLPAMRPKTAPDIRPVPLA